MALEDMFRAYDIRGNTDEELTPEVMKDIGKAYATQLEADTTIVGHDVRNTSPEMADAFIKGVTSAGVEVVDAGFSPYGPILYVGWQQVLPSAFITASHLTKEWNGVKFAHGNGIGYTEEENMQVRDRFFSQSFQEGHGKAHETEILASYKEHVLSRVNVGNVKVLMDCGNGSAGAVAPDLFRKAGVALEILFEEPDGSFPNRESDVTDESLSMLRSMMKKEDYDVGIAYDGDADRVAVVDEKGRLLSSEQVAAVLLPHLVKEYDGPIIANVECSNLLEHVAQQYDREVIRIRVGHTYLFKAMQEHKACIGVEKSRHMGVPHVLPLDDGIAASLFIAEVVSRLDKPLSAIVDDFPEYYRGRFTYTVPDRDKFEVIEILQDWLTNEFPDTNTMDGVRVEVEDGWILVRASNTSPKIRLTVEANTSDRFEKLHREFTDVLQDAIEAQEALVEEREKPRQDNESPEQVDPEREDWMVDRDDNQSS